MSRTIYTSGGRKDYAEMTLTDAKVHDLATATIRLGVSTSVDVQPTNWFAPDLTAYPTTGKAVLSLLLDSTRAPAGNDYYLWADVVDSPTTQPVCATGMKIVTK